MNRKDVSLVVSDRNCGPKGGASALEKCLIIMVFCLMGVSPLLAFSGHITTNTTWSEDIIINGDVWVDTNVTLNIGAGVTVWILKMDQDLNGTGDVNFTVNGCLVSQGTPANRVVFRSLEIAPTNRDWYGITISVSSGQMSNLSNVEIRDALTGIYSTGIGFQAQGAEVHDCYNGIRLASGIYTISNADIHDNYNYGLSTEGSSSSNYQINECSFNSNNQRGVQIYNQSGTTNISNSQINSNSQYGLYYNGPSSSLGNTSITNCQINSNQLYGVYITGPYSNLNLTQCTISSNDTGIYFDQLPATLSYCNIENNGSGIGIYKTNPTINNCNITNNALGSATSTKIFGSSDWRASSTTSSISYPTAQVFLPMIIESMTYKKSSSSTSGNTGFVFKHFTRINANSAPYFVDEYSYTYPYSTTHALSLQTISGELNQMVNSRAAVSLQIYDYTCTAPVAYVSSMNYKYAYHCGVDNYGGGGTANLQSNWWGQPSNIDQFVYQATANNAVYDGWLFSRIPNAGCDLPNLAPTMAIIEPGELAVDPDTLLISWNAVDTDDNATISLYYNQVNDTNGTLIVDDLSENTVSSYLWDLAGIADGTYYIYARIEDGSNPPVYAFAPGQVMVGGPAIVIADYFASASETVDIVIQALNAHAIYDIYACQLTLSYDPTLLTYVDTVTLGTMTEDWATYTNANVAGQVSVNGYSTASLNGSGTLLKIRFTVNASAADLQETNLTISSFQYNNGNPVPDIDSGSLMVRNKYDMDGWAKYYSNESGIAEVRIDATGFFPGTQLTDASGSFSFADYYYGDYVLTPDFVGSLPELLITPFDASMIARYALGLITFNGDQIVAGNVDADADCDVFDAAQIARYCVGLIPTFAAGEMLFSPVSQQVLLSTGYIPVTFHGIAIGDVSGNWGQTREEDFSPNVTWEILEDEANVYLTVHYPEPFHAIYSRLSYNPEVLSYSGYTYNQDFPALVTSANCSENHLTLAAFATEPQAGANGIFTLAFSKLGDYQDTDAVFDFILFDENLGELTGAEDNPVVPITSLRQNYPNPFNPTTTLRFSIDKPQRVKLDIYNVKGQKVITLADELLPAGNHSLVWNAVNCGSGIYFARFITAEGHAQTIKMMLLK